MTAARTSVAALAWLGRQRTRAVAALVFLGIALPPLGALLKPYITEAVFLLLTLAFLRVDMADLRGYLRRPGLALAATAWTALAVPLLFGGGAMLVGLDGTAPALFLALALQGIASPMMAAPALAALMGLDATLVLVTLIASTALIPLTAAGFADLMGLSLALSPLALGRNLFMILAGSALLAIVLRKVVGRAAIEHRRDEIDGLNILALFVFVAAVMAGMGSRILAAPLLVLGLTLLAFAVFLIVLAVTIAVFAWAGRERALALGFMASQRNMGLMLAATGGALPDLTWLYFAVSQFPIYLSPQLLKRPAQRIIARGQGRMAGRRPADLSRPDEPD